MTRQSYLLIFLLGISTGFGLLLAFDQTARRNDAAGYLRGVHAVCDPLQGEVTEGVCLLTAEPCSPCECPPPEKEAEAPPEEES